MVDLLCARWLVSLHPDIRPDQNHWQETGSASWWAHVWSSVVRPWRYLQLFPTCLWFLILHTRCCKHVVVSQLLVWSCSALRYHRMGGESQRSRLLVWKRRGGPVQRCQWHTHDMPGPPAGHGGLQVALQWDCPHSLVGTQLLLQVGSSVLTESQGYCFKLWISMLLWLEPDIVQISRINFILVPKSLFLKLSQSAPICVNSILILLSAIKV